jgi:hypothetical protein
VIALAFINKTLEMGPTVQSRVGSHRGAEERISDTFSPETHVIYRSTLSLQTIIRAITTPNIASPVMNQPDPLRSVSVQ